MSVVGISSKDTVTSKMIGKQKSSLSLIQPNIIEADTKKRIS